MLNTIYYYINLISLYYGETPLRHRAAIEGPPRNKIHGWSWNPLNYPKIYSMKRYQLFYLWLGSAKEEDSASI